MVLFALERRKACHVWNFTCAWRMLQSKAGVVNKDYQAQRALLSKLDKGELQLAEVQAKTRELFDAELAKLN
jgi:pyruvate-ferredoxin/flavodoxin oxidoreductase